MIDNFAIPFNFCHLLCFKHLIIVLDDEIEIKKLPLFLRDIKHIRKEKRTVAEVAEEIVKNIKRGFQDI